MSKRLQIVYSEHSLSIVITISSNCWKFYLLCIVSQEHLVLFHCSIVWPCDGKTRPSTISKHQNYLTNCTVAMLFNHHFYPQNGICIQKCNFGLRMMVKSGLEKFILKSHNARNWFPYFLARPAWQIQTSFLPSKWNLYPKIQFLA